MVPFGPLGTRCDFWSGTVCLVEIYSLDSIGDLSDLVPIPDQPYEQTSTCLHERASGSASVGICAHLSYYNAPEHRSGSVGVMCGVSDHLCRESLHMLQFVIQFVSH